MWWILLVAPARAMTVEQAVEAALARSPAMSMAEARVDEARGRVREARGRLLPSASVGGAVIGQTEIEVDLANAIPVPTPEPLDPLLVQPGAMLQGTADVGVPLLAPAGWAAHRTARRGVGLAEDQADADRQQVTARVVQAFHASAESRSVLEDALRAEALAERLLEKGRLLEQLGAVAADEVLPFERAHATARANVARAREGVAATTGVLGLLTGLPGEAEPAPVPAAAPDLAQLLLQIDRADVRAAEQGAEVTAARVGMERAGRYPTVGLQAGLVAMDPAPDFGADVAWRVSVGARLPIFQGGAVGGRVGQAKAQEARARAGVQALREAAEIEVRLAHGALSQALSSLAEQEEAVVLAQRAVTAAERRVDEGGGSLLQLQQAQLEGVAAEVMRTRARSAAARAADALTVAVGGALVAGGSG